MSVAFYPQDEKRRGGRSNVKESFMNNKYVHTPRKNALGIRKIVCGPSKDLSDRVGSD